MARTLGELSTYSLSLASGRLILEHGSGATGLEDTGRCTGTSILEVVIPKAHWALETVCEV